MVSIRSGPQYSRHLVMVHRPGWQAIEDFAEIRKRIMATRPDIAVLIASTRLHDPVLEQLAAARPTLVFSPCALTSFLPRRGRVFAGRAIDKFTQLQRLAEIGVSVPRSAILSPGLEINPAEWGTHVMIKPAGSRSARGLGLAIVPTEQVRYRAPEDYPEGHPGRHGPMLAQSFIVTGPAARHYRVNTLFGEPLYCMLNERTTPLPDLTGVTESLQSTALATNLEAAGSRRLSLVADDDVLDLARRCHESFPDVPLKGVDIVRDIGSGKLFVLELNCTSNTWHVSSDYFARFRTGATAREKMVGQFGMWDVAARVLIEKTLSLAE